MVHPLNSGPRDDHRAPRSGRQDGTPVKGGPVMAKSRRLAIPCELRLPNDCGATSVRMKLEERRDLCEL